MATAASYVLIWASGLGGAPNAAFVERTRESVAWPHASDAAVLLGWLALLATTGVVRGVASALGEEIGWRGFLAPLLTQRFGFTAGALLTGAAWTAWHLPVLLFSNYNSGTPWWFSIPCFAILVLSMSVIMSWIRLKSGSVWTAAVAHASSNAFIQAFFNPLTTSKGAITAYAVDEFGFVIPAVVFLIALLFWSRRREVVGAQIADAAGA